MVTSTNNFLLFYNTATGARAIGSLHGDGTYADVSLGSFQPGWTHIVGGMKNSVLLFYNSTSPTAHTAIGQLDATGNYFDLVQFDGVLSTGWTHIVAE